MIVDGSTMKTGGNRFKFWFGTKLLNMGTRIISRNKQDTITNPTAKLVNPFTLIVSFTVNNVDKYQVVTQGDYKKIYKSSEDLVPEISESEMFIIIDSSKSDWFKKD